MKRLGNVFPQLFNQNLDVKKPKEFQNVYTTWLNDSFGGEQDKWDEYYDSLTDEQRKRLHWLSSSEREKEYLLSLPEEDMTEQNWNDLKSCDF